MYRDELAGATDSSGGWPTEAEGGMAPNAGETAKAELLAANSATADARSADATAVVAKDAEDATAAAIGFNPSTVQAVEAANTRDKAGSSVPLLCPAPSNSRPADARLVARTDLAATARPRCWRHARRHFRTGGLYGERPAALRA